MKKLELKAYQSAAVKTAAGHLKKRRSVCLVSPTGSGKTVMAQAIAAPYRHTLTVVHTRALLKQATQRLGRTHTIQQLLKTGLPPEAAPPELIIWDECHHSASDKWSALAAKFPKARLLGLTATPERADKRGLDLFQEIVVAAHHTELVREGVLVKCRVLIPEKEIDGSDPEPVAAYRKYAAGTRALFFVRNVKQANEVAAALGAGFEPWHSKIAWGKRAKSMTAFAAGKLKGLVTVEALKEGFDVPSVETIVLGRTCEETHTFLQIVGRGLRAAPGKKRMLLLDLKGATQRHGSPVMDRQYSIDGEEPSEAAPATAAEREAVERAQRDEHDAVLVEVTDWAKATATVKRKTVAQLARLAKTKGYPQAAADEAARRLFE
jgi:superfamily II DNA or RNA helicase